MCWPPGKVVPRFGAVALTAFLFDVNGINDSGAKIQAYEDMGF